MEQTSKRVKTVAVISALLLLVVIAYWKWGSGKPDSQIERTVTDLQRRTIPAGANVLEKTELELERTGATASWTFESEENWITYSRWVNDRCPDYKFKELVDGKLFMSKQLPGDTLSVTFERVGDNPLKVRVSFRGYPS